MVFQFSFVVVFVVTVTVNGFLRYLKLSQPAAYIVVQYYTPIMCCFCWFFLYWFCWLGVGCTKQKLCQADIIACAVNFIGLLQQFFLLLFVLFCYLKHAKKHICMHAYKLACICIISITYGEESIFAYSVNIYTGINANDLSLEMKIKNTVF